MRDFEKIRLFFKRFNKSIQTSKYRLHYWESPTGMKLILNTSPEIVPCPGKLFKIRSVRNFGI